MEIEANKPDVRPVEDKIVSTAAPAASPVTPENGPKQWRRPRRRMFVGLIVLVMLVIVGMSWSWWLFGRNNYNENNNIAGNEFQAIFLTNGQVYFGKLADLNHKYVTIKDVYYLQVQSSSSNSSLQGSSNSGSSTNSQVSLVKLGNELHGPQDEMYIASNQVLFWENLKPSGKVTQAIDKYQAQQ